MTKVELLDDARLLLEYLHILSPRYTMDCVICQPYSIQCLSCGWKHEQPEITGLTALAE